MNRNKDLVKDHLVIDSKNRNGEQNHRIRGWRKHAVCNCQWHVVKWTSEGKQYHCVGKNEFKVGYNLESMLYLFFSKPCQNHLSYFYVKFCGCMAGATVFV